MFAPLMNDFFAIQPASCLLQEPPPAQRHSLVAAVSVLHSLHLRHYRMHRIECSYALAVLNHCWRVATLCLVSAPEDVFQLARVYYLTKQYHRAAYLLASRGCTEVGRLSPGHLLAASFIRCCSCIRYALAYHLLRSLNSRATPSSLTVESGDPH